MAKRLLRSPRETLASPRQSRECLQGRRYHIHNDPVRWHVFHTYVPFVNRPFESEIHGTVNFTYFCCVLLVTWCYRVLLSCYLRPK